MKHIVATGRRFRPARIGVQIGAEQAQTLADIAGAPLTQHGSHVAFTLEVTDGGARFMPSRQRLNQTMGADEPGAARDQNARHVTILPVVLEARREFPTRAPLASIPRRAKRCYTFNLGLRSRGIPTRIGELSTRTGISASRIRFYETCDVLSKPIRGENGYREYPDTAVKMLGLIDDAQRLGFSLSEIRDALNEAAPNFPSRAALIKALRSKLETIDQHMKEVRARRRQIVKLLKDMGD
jgi:DNA-binding transcriptional MerR regulator